MKRQALMILMALSLFVSLTANSVHGKSGAKLVAKIPFAFVIGRKAFPAGEYTLTYVQTYMVCIRSQDTGESMFFLTDPIEAERHTETIEAKRVRSELVFNRYEDQYFLSKLWTAGEDVGRVITMSRSEREVIRARSALAKSAPETQIVSVPLAGSKH